MAEAWPMGLRCSQTPHHLSPGSREMTAGILFPQARLGVKGREPTLRGDGGNARQRVVACIVTKPLRDSGPDLSEEKEAS